MASACVDIDQNGFVHFNGTSVPECTAYVLLDSADYAGSNVWQVPPVADLTSAWTLAFVVPMVVYLMAFSIGSVLSLFGKN